MFLEKSDLIAAKTLQRRSFLTKAGVMGLGATAAALLPAREARAVSSSADNLSGDTPQQIFTAALIAEDLACTFYYNVLNGNVITDPNLAGPGGTATNVTSGGNPGNVDYLLAAYSEELAHANLLRSLIGGSGPASDPVQFFYLPIGAFENLTTFAAVLDALESAFIGAYLNATIEFAQMAADTAAGRATYDDYKGNPYTSRDLEYFAQVSASILGVESEHRVLGRVISNTNPANNLNYEQTDKLTSVYNGKNSAVAALTPFLSYSSGMRSLDFQDALRDDTQKKDSLPATGTIPPAPVYS